MDANSSNPLLTFRTAAALACAVALPAHTETENFDTVRPGALPDGWVAGVTVDFEYGRVADR
jgi:hypothetical protein